MSAPATEVTIYQNRPLVLTLRFIKRNGARYDLTGSYEARFFRLNNTTPFATANGENGKLALQTEDSALLPSLMTLAMSAADMANIEGYGAAEIIDTVTGLPLCVLPTRMVKEGTTWTPEFGASLTIWGEQVVVTARTTQVSIDEVTGVLTAEAQTLPAGAAATAAVQVQAGQVKLTLGIPAGTPGDSGSVAVTQKNLAVNVLTGPSLIGRRALILALGQGAYSDINIDGVSTGGAIETIAGATWGSSTGSWQVTEGGVLVQRAANAPPYAHNIGNSLSGIMVQPAATNLIIGSAAPATQAITVTAQAYTLHFVGPGSITLSGAATGVLTGTGTGEANRVRLTFTPTAGTVTLTVAGSVTQAQMEAGGSATSYIPTTTAAVSRAADTCVVPVSGLSATSGSIMVDFIVPETLSGFKYVAVAYASPTNYFGVFAYSGNTIHFRTVSNNAAKSVYVSGVPTGTRVRAAGAFDGGRRRIKVRGIAAPAEATDTEALAAAPTSLRIGDLSSTYYLGSIVSSVAVLPRALSAAQIAAWVDSSAW